MLADRVRMGSGSEKIDPSTWKGIQNIVRKGKTTDFFSVGDELISNYDGREIIWQVIGIDVETPSDSNFNHSMTIQSKDCLENGVFASANDNRYINSDIRTYLNSSFLNKLDPELLAVIGKVDKKVAVRNAIGGQDSFSDKVFLLSEREVDFDGQGVITGEFVYPFYNGAADGKRIKYLNGVARYWLLRSPLFYSTNVVRIVSNSGTSNGTTATGSSGVSPACVII